MTSIDLRCSSCCPFSACQILAIAALASQGEAKMTSIDAVSYTHLTLPTTPYV